MVVLGISDSIFGSSFLYEQKLRNRGSLAVVPIIPILKLRPEPTEGWDALLPIRGCDFYYQFKYSCRLERGNAKFIADGTYRGPYYRITLYTRDFNRQHSVLWRHAQSNQHTYYVTLELATIDDFNKASLSNTITEHSRLIPLNECDNYPEYDSEQHYITYQENDPGFLQHSKPSRHEKSYSGMELKRIYDESRKSWRPITEEFADEILEQTKEKLSFLTKRERRLLDFLGIVEDVEANIPQDRAGKLLLSAKALLVAFGVTLVIIGERVEEAHG